MTRVFISYSHDSEAHVQQVSQLAYQLADLGGLDISFDLWDPNPPQGWTAWMEQGIRQADFVLIVCSEGYFDKINSEYKPDHGKGVRWEGHIIRNLLYISGSVSAKFIPVLPEGGDTRHILTPLLDASQYRLEGTKPPLDLYRALTGQPEHLKPAFKAEKTLLPSRSVPVAGAAAQPETYFNHWPQTSSLFVGREAELAMLDEAWADPQLRIVSFVAMGGAGKTALVNHWLSRMALDNYRGAARVFGWSFYSQGAGEDKQSSAEIFLEEALHWCGETDPPKDAWARGQRLAGRLRERPTLLLLDGVEPLQHPLSSDHHLSGKLKDPGLESLLTHLARQGPGPGLCLLSTRIAIPLLGDFPHCVRQQDLEQLDDLSGATLLQQLGVQGSPKEQQAASREFQGHALALTLLGRYLVRRHGGDIRQRHEIPPLEQDRKDGRAARRMMATYETWLADSAELDFLRLLGLFDRPMTPAALRALLAGPAIPGLTERLRPLSRSQALDLLENLRDLRLLARPEEAAHRPALLEPPQPAAPNFDLSGSLDTHPLIREHFDQALQAQQPAAYREAHLRLYEHYRNLPDKEQPDTLAEMEPLFAAVVHGVKAGKVQEAYDDIYSKRIRRGDAAYLTRQLGASASELGVVGSFFEVPWSRPHPALTRSDQLVCLGNAGFRLRALGRPHAAAAAIAAALEEGLKDEDWERAAARAINLSELQLALGRVAKALESAHRGVDYADRSESVFMHLTNRSNLAEALAAAGQGEAAGALFREAEEMQQARQPEYPRLYSLQGYRYASWLLEQGAVGEAAERARETYSWVSKAGWLLDMSLDTLTLGRAALLQGELPAARRQLDAAVAGLRRAGRNDYLPQALLAHAACARLKGDWPQAQADLLETQELIARTGFRLYLVDYHLELARCCRAGGAGFSAAEADGYVEEAARLAAEMGYRRRDAEIAGLRGR
ncbi:MAG: SEFIR domain-containing protein [Bacteroidia bacterium]|nr:SEFIR domain-containing protein [Bacteroidia bacterium]